MNGGHLSILNRKESDIMDHSDHTNIELLQCVLGTRAAKRLYRGTLHPLFVPEEKEKPEHHKLAAAHELVKRWMAEELHDAVQLSSPKEVAEYLRVLFAGQEHETFVALFLSPQNRLIAAEEMFRGTLTTTAVYPREIVKRGLKLNAAAAIFAHNHPSGTLDPSAADIQLTVHLKIALATVDIVVLDHFVIAGDKSMSMADRGLFGKEG
jgi:DNA repair protein RadC